MTDTKTQSTSSKEVWRLHADDVRESYKLAFESVKHVTTLTAASFVLIATFLRDIFTKPSGSLNLLLDEKIIIGASFLCFALSLIFSCFSLWRIAGLVRSRRDYPKKKRKIRLHIVLPFLTIIFGLSLFGAAVLASVLALNIIGKLVLYELLGVLVVVVTAWVYRRLRIGDSRDEEVEYKVIYPSARDCAEILNDSNGAGELKTVHLPVTLIADKSVVERNIEENDPHRSDDPVDQ